MFEDIEQKHRLKKFKSSEEFKTDKETLISKIYMTKYLSAVKVAVILNARNEEKHLGKTLKFLQDQELKPYRIIVVNDGSADKTGEIAKSYGVEVIERKKREENFVLLKSRFQFVSIEISELNHERIRYMKGLR